MTGIFTVHSKNVLIKHVLTRNFKINRMLANDVAITSIFCKIGKKLCKKCQPESKVFPRGLIHYEMQGHTYTYTNSHTHTHTQFNWAIVIC